MPYPKFRYFRVSLSVGSKLFKTRAHTVGQFAVIPTPTIFINFHDRT